MKELSLPFSKMLSTEMDDNKYYHEVQSLSNEILSDRSLPNLNYSQSVIKILQEKIDFFKTNSGMNSIDYNAVSGQLMILNEKQQILCQRNNPKFDLFREFGVSEEDVQQIQVLLHQTSVQNKELSVQIKAKVENKRQMYKLKLHTEGEMKILSLVANRAIFPASHYVVPQEKINEATLFRFLPPDPVLP